MGIEDQVIERRNSALQRGEIVVPDCYQGVTKDRVRALLTEIDSATDNMVDVVFSLLCDEPSWYSTAERKGYKFCDGASVAQIGSHVGILQRGKNIKLDREGRDYWLKPLFIIGAIEKVYFDSKEGVFKPGHLIAKSSNSAYRLAKDFLSILKAPEDKWYILARDWMHDDAKRERLALQAAQVQEAASSVESAHSRLIRASYEVYARRFLPDYEVVYIDDGDGDRITLDQRMDLERAGLDITIHDAMPDVLLWDSVTDYLWVIEAVTSDGEVDVQKVESLRAFAYRNNKAGVGFTTTYPTWKKAAERQTAMKNLAGGTWMWIQEDPSRNIKVEQ